MRPVLSLFVFLLLSVVSNAQIEDAFATETIDTTIWQGDGVSDFIIDSGRLRLQAKEGNRQSTLFADLGTLEAEYEWGFDIELDFNPSNQNFVIIWLIGTIDQSNGLYLRIGKSGSEDNVEVILRKNRTDTIVAEGGKGKASDSPQISFSIKKNAANQWLLEVDYERQESELLIISQMDVGLDQGFFILDCNYTTTRSDKFYFDNVYVGPPRIDNTPPQVINVRVDTDQILMTFDEAINQESLRPENFFFEPEFRLLGVEFPESNAVLLVGQEEFEKSTEYTLDFIGLKDLSDNYLDTSIIFILSDIPEKGDLLINEILFNPRGGGADYVEIINVTNKSFALQNMYLRNAEKSEDFGIVAAEFVGSGEIVVFTDDRENVISEYWSNAPQKIFEQAIPSFNNDEGNFSLIRKDRDDEVIIDGLDYMEDYHLSLLDTEDGVSLERISINHPTQEPKNWTSASSLSGFGTPGLINSTSNSEFGSPKVVSKVINKVFSPSNNGPEGRAEVLLEFPNPSYFATAKVYNLNGQEVKSIWQNELAGRQASLLWNGTNNEGNVLPIGIYILLLEFFNLEGQTQKIKVELVLAEYLD